MTGLEIKIKILSIEHLKTIILYAFFNLFFQGRKALFYIIFELGQIYKKNFKKLKKNFFLN